MGLIFQFQKQYSKKSDTSGIYLKTLHLPVYFWGYLAASLVILAGLYLAATGPLGVMLRSNDKFNYLLARATQVTVFTLPFILLVFFFYCKSLHKLNNKLTVYHKIFGITLLKSNLKLQHPEAFEIDHCLDSPNLARKRGIPEERAFANNGFYRLKAHLAESKHIYIDRHSQKSPLVQLKNTLSQH